MNKLVTVISGERQSQYETTNTVNKKLNKKNNEINHSYLAHPISNNFHKPVEGNKSLTG